MKKSLFVATLVLTISLTPVTGAFALTTGVNVNANVDVNSVVNTNANVGGKANVNAPIKMDQATSATSTRGNSGDKSTTTGSTSGIGEIVRVEARTVRGWDTDQKEAFMLTLKSAIQVQTGQDLENFASGVLLKNENVESVEVNDNEVGVVYKHPAKLFGMFKANLNTHVVVAPDGEVTVKYPWFRFLYSVGDNSAETDFATSIKEATSAYQEVLVSETASMEQKLQAKATMLELISLLVEAKVKTNNSDSTDIK